MKNFTIIVGDSRVAVEGEGYDVDLSELAAQGIHAVQFYGAYGEVEYKPVFDAETRTIKKPMNDVFTDADQFQKEIAKWGAAKEQAAQLAAQEQAAKLAAEAQPVA